MSPILKIGGFILFILTYVAWLYLSGKFSKRTQQAVATSVRYRLWDYEIQLIFSLIIFFAFIFLLSGFFNLQIILLLLVGGQLSILLFGLALTFGSGQGGESGVFWGGVEVGLRYARLVNWLRILIAVIVFGYPVLSGFAYFSHDLASPELTILIFRYTLITMIFVGYAFTIFIMVLVFLNENTNNDTRTASFVSLLGGLFQLGIYVGILFWSFDIQGSGATIGFGNLNVTFTPVLVIILTAYFFLLVLLPYLIGSQKSKRWRQRLLEKRAAWLQKLLDILEFPTGSSYGAKLNELQANLQAEKVTFVERDQILGLGVKIDQSPEVEKGPIERVYQNIRGVDPRINYLDWLVEFLRKLDEIIVDLNQENSEEAKEKAAQAWALAYRNRKAELAKDMETVAQIRPGVWLVIAFIATPVISFFLQKLAESAWTSVIQSLP